MPFSLICMDPRIWIEKEVTLIAATARLADGGQVLLWPSFASRLGLADTGVRGLFPPPSEADDAEPEGIFRVWTPRTRSRVRLDELPLTDRAREAQAAYNALDDDPALRCIPAGTSANPLRTTPRRAPGHPDGDPPARPERAAASHRAGG